MPSLAESFANNEVINEDQQNDRLMALRNPHNGEDTGPVEINIGRQSEDLEHDRLYRDFDINIR